MRLWVETINNEPTYIFQVQLPDDGIKHVGVGFIRRHLEAIVLGRGQRGKSGREKRKGTFSETQC